MLGNSGRMQTEAGTGVLVSCGVPRGSLGAVGGWDSWGGTKAWMGLGKSSAVTPVRPVGLWLSLSTRPACQGQREGFFPGPPFHSCESFLCVRFWCRLKARAVKPEMNQLLPRSSPAAYRDSDKTPSEGKCPCPAQHADRRGGSLISAGVTRAVLGWLAFSGSVAGAEKGLWHQFPSFTGALSSGCAKFQVVVQPSPGGGMWGGVCMYFRASLCPSSLEGG